MNLNPNQNLKSNQIKISMTMRNSFGCNFAILGYELTHKCKLEQFLHTLFAFIFFSKSICCKESNDTNIHKTGQDN